ncbi:hypothetical protein Micbo1qcDRAFT_189807 [Microdochium bolleyi]|uniref:BCL5p n=1 Tax=Microdochium bolleyi TaxID=196109 RepID=A0A136IV04_9PEZI|nr:hypothetical protein Micbo1qcDRAFT_189807 [Microdochium bolleyi]
MDVIWRLLGSPARIAPPRVQSDDVYPVHMLDDTKTLRGIVVAWTMRVDDVLDPEKLHGALARLLEIGDWKKLGGRLRVKDDGGLELHVPQPFTTERPAVSYSHEVIPMNIADHPLAKRFPSRTVGPSVQPGPPAFRSFAARQGAPTTLEDFIYTDNPQLSLHITSFQDTTLLGLSFPHTAMDVMGQQALLRSWCLVLAGRESDVPPLLGAREDRLIAAVKNNGAKEDFKLASKVMQGFGLLKFGMRFALDMARNPVVETKSIFLPQATVAALRKQVEMDLGPSEDGKAPFISTGDVLTAWATRAIASSLPQPRPVTVLHALNTRFRLKPLIEAQGVFVQNMAVAAYTFLSADEALDSLGQIALENRRQLAEQATEGQVLSFLHELLKDSKTGGDPRVLCGDSDALLLPFTNWDRANMYETADFGPAVMDATKTSTRSSPPGTLSYHHADSMVDSSAGRNVVVVLGKDHGGNYWLTGLLLPATWARIEEEFMTLCA